MTGNTQSLTDPNYGTLSTTYNAYGELFRRVSPKELEGEKETFYHHDGMGRLVSVFNGMEGTYTRYVFDEDEGPTKGTLKQMRHHTLDYHNIQRIDYEYDGLARNVRTTETRQAGIYETATEYDEFSRVSRTVFPTGVTVNYGYRNGRLQTVYDAGYNILWQTDAVNAFGQLTDATLGNGSSTHRAYTEDMHYIDSIVTTNNLQNLSYGYDKFGNLASRTDSLRMMTETFEYDKLNRLTDITFGDSHCHIGYDNLGRMLSKQAVLWKYGGPHVQTVFSSPQFDETKVHALTDATAHPDWFNTDQLSVTYTSFDKVSHAAIGDDEVSFLYGFNEERIRMSESYNTMERQKTYVANCEFITESDSGLVTEKSWTFLTCPTGVFAVVEKEGNTETLHYILKDHQGSWTVVTDAEGTVEQELSYDAWGNLRDPDTWCVDTSIKPMFDRGYTGQEHLTAFGLVNMNGRMYDPVMSSFLSVDRYVQQPDNSQGFNRYAYCMYNPLKYVDPTGWEMTRPDASRIIPPKDAILGQAVVTEYGYQLGYVEGILCAGLLGDLTIYDNGDYEWVENECKKLTWYGGDGGLSAEYSGGVATFPMSGGNGGGGLGAFWLRGYEAHSTDYGMAYDFLTYSTSTVSSLMGASNYSYLNSKNHKSLEELGKNLSKAQKAKLSSKFPKIAPKGASAAKYGEAVARGLKRTGNVLGSLTVCAELLEVGLTGEVYASNVYNIGIGIACIASGPIGWMIGGAALVGDIVSYAYSGRSIGGNIDRLFDDKGYKLWQSVY